MKKQFRSGEVVKEVEFEPLEGGSFRARVGESLWEGEARLLDAKTLILTRGGRMERFTVFRAPGGEISLVRGGTVFRLSPEEGRRRRREAEGSLASPMPGKIIKVLRSSGEAVKQGDTIVVVEAMKMELPIKAHRDGVLKKISCEVGQRIEAGVPLVELG